MTSPTRQETRTLGLRFKGPLSSGEKESLLSAIVENQGTIKAAFNDMHLSVEYDFPDTCFTEIWQAICKVIDPGQLSIAERFRNSLASFCEENERMHLLNSSHWQTYVRDVYVHYFDYRRLDSGDGRKKLWRRYQKP